MAHVYTPGLRVSERTTLRKRRTLPLRGQVLVKVGDRVQAETVVARTELPGKVHSVNIVNRLGIDPADIREFMLKKEDDPIQANEPLAETKPFIKWLKTVVASPITGTVETVSAVTGQVLLREPPRPVEVAAYVDGAVVETMEGEGVVVETDATLIQGIFGVGGEAVGEIEFAVDSPSEPLRPDALNERLRGKIIVCGSYITADALKRAVQLGLRGVIVGGLDDRDLRDLLGYEQGVAITGSENIGIVVVLTEGFGNIAIAQRTFDLLKARKGARASMSGATQIRAGVVRPEIVIPAQDSGVHRLADAAVAATGMKEGGPVRIIRHPHFGALGKVVRLPHQPVPIETEARVRVVDVQLPDGKVLTIPRANVEVIQG